MGDRFDVGGGYGGVGGGPPVGSSASARGPPGVGGGVGGGGGTGGGELRVERVTHIPNPSSPTEFVPRIAISKKTVGGGAPPPPPPPPPPAVGSSNPFDSPPGKGGGSGSDDGENVRPFRPDDMDRVLDYEGVPTHPPDCAMLHCEPEDPEGGGEGGGGGPSVSFPSRHMCLRGSYMFYFDEDDVEPGGEGGYSGPPLGVVPLEGCAVEFPPGGRRVFREHSQTAARTGYEMVIRHRVANNGGEGLGEGPDDEGGEEGKAPTERPRPPCFVVAESLGQREKWAEGIRIRANLRNRETKLRPGGTASGKAQGGGGGGAASGDDARTAAAKMAATAPPSRRKIVRQRPGGSGGDSDDDDDGGDVERATAAAVKKMVGKRQSLMAGGSSSDSDAGRPLGGDGPSEVDAALDQFGSPRFSEDGWVDDFFSTHNEFDAPTKCRELERWQNAIKKGLRGAVLEQYEYFVEASREMTTMGREVASLRSLVDGQADCIASMKNIDFAAAFADPVAEEREAYSDDEDDALGIGGGIGMGLGETGGLAVPGSKKKSGGDDDDDEAGSEATSVASSGSDSSGYGGSKSRSSRSRKKDRGGPPGSIRGPDHANEDDNEATMIEIPEWLGDATEEISAFIKECRYTDATELVLKAKAEVTEILNQHDKLTDRRLGKKQLASMQRILHGIKGLTDRMGNRLAEGLRRKNEALKQAAKRERADPLSYLAPLVSPICLNDDAVALQLLVKLGRPQDAATAYAARRSLLLMESLHERPISSAASSGTMDVVIYAAQLSQCFFSCLANAVEGFLDLFLDQSASILPSNKDAGDESSVEDSSIQSGMGRKIPAGALAAIVLWCDSELSKFSAAFGGTRVLGNLALSPPMRTPQASPFSKKLMGMSSSSSGRESIAEQRNQLRAAEEMGEFAAAATLRQKLAEREGDEKRRRSGSKMSDDRSVSTVGDNKDRQSAIEIAAKCVDQAFQFASENLDSIGLPLTPRLAEYIRSRLKGCEVEIAQLLEGRWSHITVDWKYDPGMESAGDHRRDRMGDLRASARSDDV